MWVKVTKGLNKKRTDSF